LTFRDEGIFEGEMSFKPNKIRVIEFDTDYINSLKLIVDEEDKIKDAFTGFIISPYHGNNLQQG
jgi:hypothetical protein